MKQRDMVVLTCALTLSGCQSVKVQFAPPPQGNDPKELAKLAKDGFSYFVLGTDYVLVAPTADVNSGQGKPKSEAAAPSTNPSGAGGAATGGSNVAGSSDSSADHSASSGKTASTTRTQHGSGTAAGASHTGAGTSGAGQSGSDSKPATDSQGKAAPATDTNTAPPAFNNPLATTTIDKQSWSATVVPMPDPQQAYYVKGVSGFWDSTTLGVAHYQNSDLVSSISVTAQNLVPTRIGQIGSAIASIVGIAVTLGVSGVSPTPLAPFYFKVPDTDTSGNVDDYWVYQFKFDPAQQPAGTVTLDQWKQLIAGKTEVNYWPVPACRNATLTLGNSTLDLAKKAYQFQLVVASQQYVRLQPLPVSGKLDLGTVCGSSTNGTTTVDTLGNVTDDLTAFQKAIQQIKSAKNPKSNSSGSGSSSSSSQ
jgi:hypothetical protein